MIERDIIDKLMDFDLDHTWSLRGDAANEIEHLRAINAELLKVTQRLITDYEDVPDPTDADGQAVFQQARAAIARAKGEA